MVLSNCVFQGTDTGIRVKTQRGRGGVVEGFNVANVVMQDVATAFSITAFYSGKALLNELVPAGEGTPVFRDFHFSNITARGSKSIGEITGLREMPFEGITFSGVRAQAQTGLKITNAKDIAFQDVVFDVARGEALETVNAAGIDTARLRVVKH